MKKRFAILGLLFSIALSGASLHAWGETSVKSIPDWPVLKPLVCDPSTMEDLKAINGVCTTKNFTVWHEDLNKDGTPEWLFFGPSGECGAHGNCPFRILKKVGAKWTVLNPACPNQDCLTMGNALYSKVLPTVHQGYRDLEIAGDDSSFFWTKQVYEWDGKKYQANPSRETYFIYDQDKGLVNVSKEKYEKCSKGGGEGCL